MGKLLGNLTNTGVADPNTGGVQYAGSPAAAGIVQAQQAAQYAQPSSADIGPQGTVFQQPQVASPRQFKPSFMQAANSGPAGSPNALNPGLTTKGRVLVSLLSGLSGGLAGAGSRTVGEGFQRGAQAPFLPAFQRQQLQKGDIENQLGQAQIANLPWQRAALVAGVQKSQAETLKDQAEAAGYPAKQALEKAQTEAAFYKDDPNLGLIDIRTGQPVNSSAIAPLDADEAAVLGKQPGERVPLKLKNTANEIATRGRTTVATEEGVYDYNRRTGEKKRLGANPRMVFAPENRIIPTVDPNNPGNIVPMKAGEALKQGVSLPQSAEHQAANTVLKSAVGGKIGEEINAFNTALQHADLLQQALTALGNGDQRTLNSLRNRFKTEFGSADVTNFQAIAQAYTREITKMLSAGHMTDSEISAAGATLPANASPQQILGTLQAYRALAASKMQMRRDQVQQGLQGKPNFPGAQPIFAVNPTTKQRIVSNDGGQTWAATQ
jgi:hypothetical protein